MRSELEMAVRVADAALQCGSDSGTFPSAPDIVLPAWLSIRDSVDRSAAPKGALL